MSLVAAQNLSLQDIEQVTGILLGMGVVFAEEYPSDDDESIDRTRTDYAAIYNEVLSISPNTVPLIDYLNEIRPPQYGEWRILIPQAQNGNLYARNRLVDMYLRVVVKLALNFRKNEGSELDDLIQEGTLGLIRAVIKYDSGKHGSFVSYMPWWIMQYMKRAFADKGRLIRLPVHMVESLKSVENKINELSLSLDREPSIAEIADYISISEGEVSELKRYMQEPISLNEFEREDEDGFLWFDIPDNDSSIDEIIERKDLYDLIRKALNTLKEREQGVLQQRYGIEGGVMKTLEEIGISYGLTRERIRQIEEKALEKLTKSWKYKFDSYC